MPDFLKDPYIKDVTSLYQNTSDISVRASGKMKAKPHYAYLCVFNTLAWQPIAIGEYKKTSAMFQDMGRDLVYLPVFFNGRAMTPLNYPFDLTNRGTMEQLIPDVSTLQTLHLTRKYPYSMALYQYYLRTESIDVVASNNPDFNNADIIMSLSSPNYQVINKETASNNSYRYWKFVPSRFFSFMQATLDIAELAFFDSQNQRIKGVVSPAYEACFDDDPLTNISIKNHKEHIVVDFAQPVTISRIACVPRGDGNGIYPDNVYELFYYGESGWVSLGRKVADNYHIEYDNVPTGALYWLRNHTTGVEERIFTYENGSVRFW